MPCYDGENTNFKGACSHIRCDAAAVGYKSFALFKKLLNVSDTAEDNFSQVVKESKQKSFVSRAARTKSCKRAFRRLPPVGGQSEASFDPRDS
jgi:hypothetical protein